MQTRLQSKQQAEQHQSKQQPELRVGVVDVGTELSVADIAEYQRFIAKLLGANRVCVVRIAENVSGVFVIFLDVFGNIQEIAMKRLQSRGSGFYLKWTEDAADHGDLNLRRVIY